MDSHDLQASASHVVLHAWAAFYLTGRSAGTNADIAPLAARLHGHAAKLQESAAQLAAALEKMRIANAKLALRMAEHKAFFLKYQAPE